MTDFRELYYDMTDFLGLHGMATIGAMLLVILVMGLIAFAVPVRLHRRDKDGG